jgi:hypothetical protein
MPFDQFMGAFLKALAIAMIIEALLHKEINK